MGAATLLRLARKLHEATSLPEVMDHVVDAFSEATRYQRAFLNLPMEHGVGIELIGYAVADRKLVVQRMSDLDWRKDRLLTLEMTTEKTLVIPDLRYCEEADQRQVEFFGNRTIIAVPMLRLGERIGCLNVATYAAEGVIIPTPEEVAFAEEVGALVTVVAGRLRAEEKHRSLEVRVEREQRLEALGRMAGEVAHDLNNILVTILGNAELLQGATSETERSELLTEVLEAGHRAAGLTRQLLAFSRGQPVEVRPLDLADEVGSLEPMLRRLLPAPISLDVRLRSRTTVALANAGQLEQVLLNLVLNARDAIDGDGRITLSLDSVERDGRRWAALSVEDTGAGMSAEVSTRIFEPFFTTKAAGKGTGLGLAVVEGVVRSHKGSVEVASKPGEGSRFTVYLPELSEAEARPHSPASAGHELKGTEHVLVADDDASVRVLLERVLTGAGYRVTMAKDGREALDRLAEVPDVALVVTDLVMQRMRGDELLQRIAGRIPGLLISGYAPNNVVLDAETNVLAKPFSTRELLTRVRELLDGKTAVERS